MIRVAITGGIGSGKSTLCQQLEEHGLPVFYCDVVARQLMLTDEALRASVKELTGSLEKAAIRNYIAQGEAYAQRLNQLVWPRVADMWQVFCVAHESAGMCIMECALLFESGFDRYVDASILVVAPAALREQRVAQRDGLSAERVRSIMALQLSDEEKCLRTPYVIVNDGAPNALYESFRTIVNQWNTASVSL